MSLVRAGRVSFLALLVGCSVVSFGFSAKAEKKTYVGDMATYKAVYEDTLVHLARKYDIGFIEIRAANPELDPWIPGEGAEVVIPTRHLIPDGPKTDVLINVPEMRIYIFKKGQDEPYTFPIAVGREGLGTPMGKTTVVRKVVDPIWRPTPRMRKEDPKLKAEVLPGPDNPMGTHALYLGWPQYAIHGTNKPYGIGRRASSGCIRMYPEDILEVYKLLPVGASVFAVNQPIKVAWIGDELYIEAHPDLEQALMMEVEGAVSYQKLSDEDMKRIISKAGPYQDLLNWPKIRTAVRERKGYPIKIAQVTVKDKKKLEKTVAKASKAENVLEITDAEVGEGGNNGYTKVVAKKAHVPLPQEKPSL